MNADIFPAVLPAHHDTQLPSQSLLLSVSMKVFTVCLFTGGMQLRETVRSVSPLQ